MKVRLMFRPFIITALLSSMAVVLPDIAAADLSQTLKFNIAPQLLQEALIQYTTQSGVQITSPAQIVSGKGSTGVVGELPARNALEKLLEGTQLTFEVVNANTVTIRSLKLQSQTSSDAAGQISLAQTDQTSGARQESAARTPENSDAVIQEIIVTAQKREERLRDVPISMTVLTGSDLDRSTSTSVGDAISRVPGVSLDSGTGAFGGGTQLSVRGVNAPSGFANGPSPTAFYLDAVPFGLVRSSAVPDANVYDLQSVEVLRGPQGTLYGASAQAGVVRILTHEADLNKFELKSRAIASSTEYGGDNGQLDAAVNVPIVDGRFAIRAAAGYQSLSGWIDKSTQADYNDSRQRYARLKVHGQPTEKLGIFASAWSSRMDAGSSVDNATDGVGRFSAIADVESGSQDFDLLSLKLVYDFSAFSLTSSTSNLDYTRTVNVGENLGPNPPARTRSVGFADLSAKTFTQEVYLSSTAEGNWRWTAGGTYRDGKDNQFQDIAGFTYPALIKYSSESWAVFGELTRKFIDGRIELTAGLRYFEDTVGQIHAANNSNDPPPAGTAPPAEDVFHKTTPRLILSWHPTHAATVYASYAEGFRSGLHQNPVIRLVIPNVPLAQPDLLKNYEIGTKGALLGGHLNYELAGYYMDWQDVQLPLGITIDQVIRNVLINGSSASGIGVDAALSVEPLPGLNLGLSGSWNDLAVDEDVFSTIANGQRILLYASGDRLNGSVEKTVGASGSYQFPIGDTFKGKFSAVGSWRSKNIQKTIVGTSVATTQGDPIQNVRAGFAVESTRGWSAEVFAENLTNEQDVAVNYSTFRIYPRPRTVGVQFAFEF